MSIELTESELARCAKNPDVLRALANEHDFMSAEADAIGDERLGACIDRHDSRASALRLEADRIESEA